MRKRVGNLEHRVQEMEKEAILSALEECNWIMARAAKKLGITERMIGYKIKKYGITKEVRWVDVRHDEVNGSD